jgi:hypothetical protein
MFSQQQADAGPIGPQMGYNRVQLSYEGGYASCLWLMHLLQCSQHANAQVIP